MPKKPKNSPATPSAPVSWRDLPQDIPEGVSSPLTRQRQMRGFFKIYGIVFGLALAAVLVLAAPKISRALDEKLAARIPDSPIANVEFKSNGALRLGWFNSHVGLPAGSTLQRFDHVALRERLLTFGQVEQAEVGKKVPGTLVITLRERTPFARIAIQGPDGLPAVRLCSTDGTIYEGHGYDQQFLSSLPILSLRGLQRDGKGGFKSAAELAFAAELMAVARAQFPELARSWKVMDLTHFYGDPLDPAAWIAIRSDAIQRLLIPPNNIDRTLARLKTDLASGPLRQIGPIAELDLRRLPGAPFGNDYTVIPATPPAPAKPAKATRTASAPVRR